ncbi:MAG: thioredoxin-like domain-containing protein [Coriobacteriia bacterium]|nr:thioredoxin-like domain-containing protein [Coriobacteriia bacterium]
MCASWLGSLSAPEFKEGLDWINTGGRDVRLSDLRGRVVLLDFWTYGCINCRHVQPRLRELERRFPDTLTVVGVHAGKFTHERITENLALACDRQNVVHAVVNDRQYRIWRSFDVSAWPTVALIAADGELLGLQPGEFPLEPMADAINSAIADAEKHGKLVRGPDRVTMRQPRAEGTLRFPGRVLVAGDRMVIADTGHGRVLDCALSRDAAGTPVAHVTAEHTGFDEPQGLAVLGGRLYVADRAAQAVWRLGPDDQRERVLGTGELGEGFSAGGFGPKVDVRSPWGLAALEDWLVVGMAGSHQLWRLDHDTLAARPWAGTGGEELTDGTLGRALIAQPTGVSALGTRVAFADCESSAIRVADEAVGVRTIVGKGLFTFGDKDGVAGDVQLQHAEDLAAHDGVLAVADTYNDRLKRINPVTRESRPWDGEAGQAGALREPAGISSDGTMLAVADTGNHRVVLVEPDGSLTEVRLA